MPHYANSGDHSPASTLKSVTHRCVGIDVDEWEFTYLDGHSEIIRDREQAEHIARLNEVNLWRS